MTKHIPHILIVDDDERILKLLQQFLGKNGYEVSTAISVVKAEEYIQSTNFDLLMLDVMMPGITGIDLHFQNLKKECVGLNLAQMTI